MSISFDRSDRLFQELSSSGRFSLLEHEVYQVLSGAGIASVPLTRMVKAGEVVTAQELAAFPGEKIVLKVVSPTISHKTDVGGVKIVEKQPEVVNSVLKTMLQTIPGRYVDWLRTTGAKPPREQQGLAEAALKDACQNDIRGVLLTEFVPTPATGLGYELLVGLRWTREFGPVITVGLGGTDTELYAKVMQPGLSAISASALECEAAGLLELFRPTLAYQKARGLTRAGANVVSDEQLLGVFQAFITLARHYGPDSDSPYRLLELEINPFVYTAKGIVPLDGKCHFAAASAPTLQPPYHKIRNLLHPKSMAVIGVSANKMNMGRIILRNIVKNHFDKSHLYVIRQDATLIDDVRCVPTIADLPEQTDVLVVAIDAAQVPETIQAAAASGKVESVVLIPGGFGEKSGTEDIVAAMNNAIRQSRSRPDRGPVFVGGNCLGILSRPGNYDTLFVPQEKLPKNYDKPPDPVAFLSQSGARMITVMSRHANLAPLFAVSTGNQMDLGINDFLDYMSDHEPEVKVFAVYIEGFQDLGGVKMIRTLKKLKAQGRDVIFYKAGRSEAGKSATAGHTASVAGDYTVCASLIAQAGGLVCDNFTDFQELIRLAAALRNKKITGNRLAAISNAGYEAVGIADNTDANTGLVLAAYTKDTHVKLQKILTDAKIDSLVDIHNPMDVTPMATDEVHEQVVLAQLADPNVDCMLTATVPLTPAQQTLPAGVFGQENIDNDISYPKRLIRIHQKTQKPMVVVIDSGILYDPMVTMMEKAGLIVFRTADLALRILTKYVMSRLKR